jgi:regulator of replication initiation timing
MDFSVMSYGELEDQMDKIRQQINDLKEELEVLHSFKVKQLREQEIKSKLGSLSEADLELVKKMVAQSMTPAPIDTAEDIKL